MPRHEHVFNLHRTAPYECGAALVTILAFPEEDAPESLVMSCHRSLCSMAIRARMEHDPAWGFQPQAIKPIYASYDSARTKRDHGHLEKRLKHRMLAAKMVIPFLMEAETGAVPELPPDIKRLSVSQLANWVLPESGNAEPKNVADRIWRRSLPVIHFAAAITLISSEYVRLGLSPITIASLIIDPVTIGKVVEGAKEVEALLTKSPRAHVDVDSLIQVRLAA